MPSENPSDGRENKETITGIEKVLLAAVVDPLKKEVEKVKPADRTPEFWKQKYDEHRIFGQPNARLSGLGIQNGEDLRLFYEEGPKEFYARKVLSGLHGLLTILPQENVEGRDQFVLQVLRIIARKWPEYIVRNSTGFLPYLAEHDPTNQILSEIMRDAPFVGLIHMPKFASRFSETQLKVMVEGAAKRLKLDAANTNWILQNEEAWANWSMKEVMAPILLKYQRLEEKK